MILITGGCGYIGSHTVVELLVKGYEVIILDSLVNSSSTCLNRIKEITKKDFIFINGDILDSSLLDNIFHKYEITDVIHFAGLKSVSESLKKPLDYFNVNINGTLNLLKSMDKAGVYNLIFSSSATVYGDLTESPIKESSLTGKTLNPYGTSKYIIEKALQNLAETNNNWTVVILRYFNPIGAHSSGLIGEDSDDTPSNLLPYISQVAIGKKEYVNIFGNDYETFDGTGIRDYIHVVDLAFGHIQALNFLLSSSGCNIFNLGTGRGYSVLEVINTFMKVSNKTIKYKFKERRAGDISISYADIKLSKKILKWEATRDLTDMIEDLWRWQKKNPNGYN